MFCNKNRHKVSCFIALAPLESCDATALVLPRANGNITSIWCRSGTSLSSSGFDSTTCKKPLRSRKDCVLGVKLSSKCSKMQCRVGNWPAQIRTRIIFQSKIYICPRCTSAPLLIYDPLHRSVPQPLHLQPAAQLNVSRHTFPDSLSWTLILAARYAEILISPSRKTCSGGDGGEMWGIWSNADVRSPSGRWRWWKSWSDKKQKVPWSWLNISVTVPTWLNVPSLIWCLHWDKLKMPANKLKQKQKNFNSFQAPSYWLI